MRIELTGRNPLRRQELRADYLGDEGNLVLDARCLKWVSPLDLAAIVAMGAKAAAQGSRIHLLLPHDPKVASYLVRMNVVQLLEPIAKIEGLIPDQVRRDHSDKLLEVTRVAPANVAILGETLGQMVTRQLGTRAGRAAFSTLAELLGNATTHGYSDIGAFAAAQLYTGVLSRTPGFEFAVCDAGCGIAEHLRSGGRGHHFNDDRSALEHALEYGVAGTPQGRGHGLTHLGQHAAREGSGGEFVLRSGGAFATVQLRKDRITVSSTVATTVAGTWAWLRVRVL